MRVLTLLLLTVAACAARPRAWWVDSLDAVLVDDPIDARRAEGRLDLARGEIESLQIAVRTPATMLVAVDAASIAPGLDVRVRRVGRVPVKHGTPNTPVSERVASAPAELPDPLLPEREANVAAERTESFLLDVEVAPGVPAGRYRTTVSLRFGDGTTRRLSLDVHVHAATIPVQGTFHVTQWFAVRPGDLGFPAVGPDDEAWWRCARLILDDLWAHRQDHFWTPLDPPWIRAAATADGGLRFDFSLFDRWVEEVSRPRGGTRRTYIEAQPVAGRRGGYDAEIVGRVWAAIDGVAHRVDVPADSPAAREGYRVFLTALRDHLRERGWLDRFRLHVSDEPHGAQLEPYRVIAGYVKEFAPEIRVMEALDVREGLAAFDRLVDVWVPQLGRFDASLPLLEERMRRGKPVWFYTCLVPRGRYPNRLIDLPLIKTRLLPWLAFRYGFDGFLHWGYDAWRGDPYEDVEPPHEGDTVLPPGDAWIVYPGDRSIVSSRRHEALRDGIEDFELLVLARRRSPDTAARVAETIVRGFTDYARSPVDLRIARRALLEALDR